jgi:hypothetical protein
MVKMLTKEVGLYGPINIPEVLSGAYKMKASTGNWLHPPCVLLSQPEACSPEQALAIVRVRSPLNSSFCYSSEASACEHL